MSKLLSSDEVGGHLKLLREGIAVPAFREEPRAFIDLVWQKVETVSFEPTFSFTPAYAALLCILMLVYGLWAYQKNLAVSKRFTPIREAIFLKGIILETGGIQPSEIKSTVSEGDRFATDQDSWFTFYLPGAGYFHLAEDSVLTIDEMERAAYKLRLEQGRLYSRLEHLETGSVFQYETPFGRVRVLGTDFLLGINKDDGMTVNVLDGTVEVEAEGVSAEQASVRQGAQALISPYSEGTILVTEMEPEQKMKLENDFDSIFHTAIASKLKQRKAYEPSFRILSREEG